MSYCGINNVNFGHIAAEDEADTLQSYFVETTEYSQVVVNKKKILVIGRKGSGKSAIFVALRDYLPEQHKNVFVDALNLKDYPWNIHKQIKDSGAPDEHTYVNSWKYIIWVLLAKRIVEYSQPARYKFFDLSWWKRIFNANIRFLRRFLIDTYGSIAPTFVELLADRARNVQTIGLKGFEAASSTKNDPYDNLSRSINIANQEILSRVLEVMSDNKKYYVLFDQLDLGWDNKLDTQQLLIGLILAARDIVRVAEKNNKQIHVIVFLRSDIYETLRFEDKNKLSPDVIEIKWDDDRLKQLISERIRASSGGFWEDVFTDTLMRSRQSPLNYIVKRTMLRPRDMIQFCSDALSLAKSKDSTQIETETIYDAERPYSDYMRKEIQDETKSLDFNIDTLFEILRKLRFEVFEKDSFIELCKQMAIDNAELALQVLIDLNVLGVYFSGGRSGGSKLVFRYEAEPWEKLEPSSKLRVHPGLKYALGLVEPRS